MESQIRLKGKWNCKIKVKLYIKLWKVFNKKNNLPHISPRFYSKIHVCRPATDVFFSFIFLLILSIPSLVNPTRFHSLFYFLVFLPFFIVRHIRSNMLYKTYRLSFPSLYQNWLSPCCSAKNIQIGICIAE